MSVLVKELLAEGLVTREPDAQDRRAVKVGITAAGAERLKRDGARLAQTLETLLEPMDDDALADLVKGEAQLERALQHQLLRHSPWATLDEKGSTKS